MYISLIDIEKSPLHPLKCSSGIHNQIKMLQIGDTSINSLLYILVNDQNKNYYVTYTQLK